jgi:hypothetical protein
MPNVVSSQSREHESLNTGAGDCNIKFACQVSESNRRSEILHENVALLKNAPRISTDDDELAPIATYLLV